jgi:hypothetical protein
VTILQFEKADFKKSNTSKAKIPVFDFKIMTVHTEVDELDDVMWGKDGTCQMQYLERHIRALNSNYGDFSNIAIGFNVPTSVTYKVMVDVEGEEVFQTRGKHPEFYEGWVSSLKRRSIFSTSLDFDRQSHKRESRFWLEGYLTGCFYQSRQFESGKASRLKAPYVMGVLMAYSEMQEKGLTGYKDRVLEDNVNLVDKIFRSGYAEMTKACNALWTVELPDFS